LLLVSFIGFAGATLDQEIIKLKNSDEAILSKIENITKNVRMLNSVHNRRRCSPCKPIIRTLGKACDCTAFPPKKDCTGFYDDGLRVNGIYRFSAPGFNQLTAYCDQTTMGGGWTVIQRRQDGSVDFNRNWDDYKRGFGALTGEFWFGNDNIHELTKTNSLFLTYDPYLKDTKLLKKHHLSELLINMRMRGQSNSVYARYTGFLVEDEHKKYRVNILGFYGNVTANRLDHINHYKFTTRDNNNQHYHKKCSSPDAKGWWINSCNNAYLNGAYRFSGPIHERIHWDDIAKDIPEFVEMKVRKYR